MGLFLLTLQIAKMAPVSVKDVDQQKFVFALAAFLKKSGKVKVPEWADIVKTSVAKELAPYDEDWYYTRLASVARHLYMRSPVGVKTITKIYGVRRNNGTTPSHWCRGSGSVARRADGTWTASPHRPGPAPRSKRPLLCVVVAFIVLLSFEEMSENKLGR